MGKLKLVIRAHSSQIQEATSEKWGLPSDPGFISWRLPVVHLPLLSPHTLNTKVALSPGTEAELKQHKAIYNAAIVYGRL